jgi:hypothetical protein
MGPNVSGPLEARRNTGADITGPPWESNEGSHLVELRGLEPLTPSMPWRCATNCATAPCREAGRA